MISRKLDILQRQGKITEARTLLASVSWYRCGNLYYKPSINLILDGSKQYTAKLDIKNCFQVPFSQVDALEAKIGITYMPTVSNPIPKGRCCR